MNESHAYPRSYTTRNSLTGISGLRPQWYNCTTYLRIFANLVTLDISNDLSNNHIDGSKTRLNRLNYHCEVDADKKKTGITAVRESSRCSKGYLKMVCFDPIKRIVLHCQALPDQTKMNRVHEGDGRVQMLDNPAKEGCVFICGVLCRVYVVCCENQRGCRSDMVIAAGVVYTEIWCIVCSVYVIEWCIVLLSRKNPPTLCTGTVLTMPLYSLYSHNALHNLTMHCTKTATPGALRCSTGLHCLREI